MNTNIKFNNLIELTKYFASERKCAEHLAQLRWGDTPACVHCGSVKVYKCKAIKSYICGEKECGKRFSVITGTFFENTKLPLSKWFIAIYLCFSHKKGVSSCQLARDLSITQKAAWHVLHRIRSLVAEKNPAMFQGIIEVDETYVGGKAGNKHAKKRKELKAKGTGYINKTMVFGILEREGRIYTQVVANVFGNNLKPIIKDNVQEGSLVMTDGFGAYHGLNKDYQHEILNHHKGEYVRGKFHTNSIEGFWSQLKRGLYGIYHQVSPKHLHRYCNEFAFKYWTRKASEQQRFDIALLACSGNLSYKVLIAPKA